MNYMKLGNPDLQISRICMGCMGCCERSAQLDFRWGTFQKNHKKRAGTWSKLYDTEIGYQGAWTGRTERGFHDGDSTGIVFDESDFSCSGCCKVSSHRGSSKGSEFGVKYTEDFLSWRSIPPSCIGRCHGTE